MRIKPSHFLISLVLVLSAFSARAEPVTVTAADGDKLNAHLIIPEGAGGPYPAVVFLHGCGGLGRSGGVFTKYRAWAQHLSGQGFAVLMIDSAGSRGLKATCGKGNGREAMFRLRPGDAYAGLRFLQARADISPDRIGLIGWSQGGGVALLTIVRQSIGRPNPAPLHDFRAAVAFYPAACSVRLQSRPFTELPSGEWSSVAPLLVLHGGADNWALAAPCKTFVDTARKRGEPVEIVIYPGALHSFDAPNMARRELPGQRTASGEKPLLGTDPSARADALKRVPLFLKRYLLAD